MGLSRLVEEINQTLIDFLIILAAIGFFEFIQILRSEENRSQNEVSSRVSIDEKVIYKWSGLLIDIL